jgi:riboflavin synthase
MFTGIITHLGKLKDSKNNRLTFTTDKSLTQNLTPGASIAINGICLTIEKIPTQFSFSVTVMPETLKRTNIGSLQKNSLVNLELPMTPANFLAGHIVQGHIDGTGIIKDIKSEGNSRLIKISIDQILSKYIVDKGSIAVNGISLTVIQAKNTYFTIGIIPYTWEKTMLHKSKIGDTVNIETDILAKYLQKITSKSKS